MLIIILSQDTLTECELIQRSLTISSEVRPQCDVQYLLNQEVDSLQIDRTISQRIYLEKMNFIIRHLYSYYVLKSKEW